MNTPPRQFQIVLKAGPQVDDPVYELKALLKTALRKHGFKCLLAAPEPHRDERDR